VCQAYTTNMRQDQGIWYLDINEDRGRRLKNPGSVRRVPLHRAILREGFLEYVKSLPEGRLFPDLKPDRLGSPGSDATKQLGKWIRSLGIKDPKKVPNHSWRHRFKDLCRGAGIEKAVNDALMGHASSDVGDQYGLGYPLKALADAIAKIPVPPLEPATSTREVEASDLMVRRHRVAVLGAATRGGTAKGLSAPSIPSVPRRSPDARRHTPFQHYSTGHLRASRAIYRSS
jgi:hypothetical protein